MYTEKLYYSNQYQRAFNARVLECSPDGASWRVVLDRTAFYPEGGGQPGDCGVLGGAAVTDTQEIGGRLVHICAAPLEQDSTVDGEINWPHRFDLMQQHSGEHIFSGLVHSRYGLDNVGFHLGAETTVIDFSGELSWEQLMETEHAANEIIWQNAPINASWPDAETLKTLSYRSKKELNGPVRIVTAAGADTCACCGVHVAHAGEIGLIKIVSAQKARGGTRAELLCGERAYGYISRITEQNRRVSALLSAPSGETAAAAERTLTELEQTRYRLHGALDRLFRALAQNHSPAGTPVFLDGLDADELRRLSTALAEENAGRAAAFSGTDTDGYKYAVIRPGAELAALVRELNAALDGRGGGRSPLAQGTVKAVRQEIEAFFARQLT